MISYARLARSQAFYEKRKFQTVEAPWEVERNINGITKPSNVQHLMLYPGSGKALVASAEQSFLQLRANGKLPDGDYQAITPCFRDEIVDDTHKRMFIKNELIKIGSIPFKELEVHCMAMTAQAYFLTEGIDTEIVKTDEAQFSRDLICVRTGIEMGSYGQRHHPDIGYWIYGTGLAEPRFSFVQDNINLLG